MIKIYLDWNVMSGMKRGVFSELTSILEDTNKFLLLFSTSHISDIYTSYSNEEEQQKIIQQDLEYITNLTNNLCLFNNGENVKLDYFDPNELLQDNIENSELLKDFSIDKIFSMFATENAPLEVASPLKSLLTSLDFENSFKEAYATPEGEQMMEELFPGLKEDFSIGGLFKAFGKMLENLNEKEGYKDLRKMVQKVGVNSGHFSVNKNPFDVIETAYKKLGIKSTDVNEHYEDNNKNAPKWFNDITNEYIKLDIHGFKADKIKVTEKKKSTFKNTTEDSFHTAFASRCEFYITNDNKNFYKTREVYKKLNINTFVLKPNEFVDYFNKFLNINNFDNHFANVIQTIKSGKDFHQTNYKDGLGTIFIHYSNCYFFDFFNKIMLPIGNEENEALFILSKENPSKEYIISYKEIENLIKLFTDKLGEDDNSMTNFKIGEIKDDNWDGRIWTTEISTFKLCLINGWFQLYFYVNKKE